MDEIEIAELTWDNATEEAAGRGTGARKRLPARFDKVERLQRKLYAAAKENPDRRFHNLYQHVFREVVLATALWLQKKNKGAPGVDGRTFEDIERYGRKKWLRELRDRLREGGYKAQPVRRVLIEKPEGGSRPLGIPVVEDRVVQTAVLLIIGPILEADFTDNCHGFRSRRNQKTALQAIRTCLARDERFVVDADLSKYFDSIPHADLLSMVSRRLSDKRIFGLIRMWLKSPVKQRDEKGHVVFTSGRRKVRGSPQGGVISPMLAVLYLDGFIKMWNSLVLLGEMKGSLVSYADDFVILCPSGQVADRAYEWANQALSEMGLTLNREKSCVRGSSKEPFDFLGFTLGPVQGSGVPVRPADKALENARKRFTKKVSDPTRSAPAREIVKKANEYLVGWRDYFTYGNFPMAFAAMDEHVLLTLQETLSRFPEMQEELNQDPEGVLYGALGVIRLRDYCKNEHNGNRSDAAACRVTQIEEGGGMDAPGGPGRVPPPLSISTPIDEAPTPPTTRTGHDHR
ncbi:MAG: group II intron reverse transcriptase/maturase [Planctomycetes bacterium]|nr:group II intron reverse transcriptase/maturase [Planctomycetota bacterium]